MDRQQAYDAYFGMSLSLKTIEPKVSLCIYLKYNQQISCIHTL